MVGGKWTRRKSEAPELFLRLKDVDGGKRTLLRVVDTDGEPVDGGDILKINNTTGLVRLLHKVDEGIGFELHPKSGRVLVRKRGNKRP